jgi:hypothetical protein
LLTASLNAQRKAQKLTYEWYHTGVGYGLDGRGVAVRVSVGSRIFSSLGPTQPPIQWIPEAHSPRVRQPGREADHSPPTCAEVKKMWIYTSTPPSPSWGSASGTALPLPLLSATM